MCTVKSDSNHSFYLFINMKERGKLLARFVFVLSEEIGKVTPKPHLNLCISPGDLVCFIIYNIFFEWLYLMYFCQCKEVLSSLADNI